MTDQSLSANKLLIKELLEKELAGFNEFKTLLLSEQDVLIHGDTTALSEIVESKDRYAEKLNTLAEGRLKLLASLGFVSHQDDMTQWINQSSKDIAALWNALVKMAQELKHINEVNGKIISTRLQYTQQSLSALLTAVNQANVYGPDGQPHTMPQNTNARGIIGKA